ncbi:unnamed protein product, partial [Meganyctiphanes norvegica]
QRINNMNTKICLILLAAVAGLASADKRPTYSYQEPQNSYSPPQNTYQAPEDSSEEVYSAPSEESYSSQSEEEEEYGYGPAKYDFDWSVKDEYSGNDFGQEETRDGDRTDGSYYVHLPDGRLQKVTYYVDGDSGYVAEVTYEGEAQYPEASEESSESYEAPKPSYSAPSPSYSAPESEESEEAVVSSGRYGAPRN